jgi:DNA sulfur modification protein DndD
VILLSTDTEVDEPFYQGLARHVSHAYHLVFDEEAGTARAEKGYFWKHLDDEVRDVA